MLYLLFAGWWAWLFFLAMLGIMVVAAFEENGKTATWTLVLGTAGLVCLSDWPVADVLMGISLTTGLMYFGGYLGAGTGWSFFKWGLFVRKASTNAKELRQEFLKSKNVDADLNTTVPEEHQEDWNKWKLEHNYAFKDARRPTWKQNKGRILFWMAYWPISMISFVIRDPFKYISELLSGWYDDLSAKLFDQSGDF